MKRLLICFAAGCIGAMANSLAIWACGKYGVSAYFNVQLSPALTPEWLYPRIVWGQIGALLFVLPLLKSRPLAKGVFMSLFPSLFQLLFIFPFKAKKGYLGLDLGTLTPLFVIVFNLIWGVVTSWTIRWSR